MEREQLKKIKESASGITLIALVVTIVVLIILAAVTVQVVIGEDGLLNRTEKAQILVEQSTVLEQTRLAAAEKRLDTEKMNMTVIEYLKSEGIIKDEVRNVAVLEKLADTSSELKVAETDVTKDVCYIVNVEKMIEHPVTGKGNMTEGNVYYILNTDLYYMDSDKKVKKLGNVYAEGAGGILATDPACFNYEVNGDDQVEITGLIFDKLEYQESTRIPKFYRKMGRIEILNMETLVIPSQIDGKDVVEVRFTDNIGIDVDSIYGIAVFGIKEIIYPDTVLSIRATDLVFEDMERLQLPKNLREIGRLAFKGMCKMQEITIPASVEEIEGYYNQSPFHCWDEDAVINVEGKASMEEMYVYDSYGSIDNRYWNGDLKVNFLGKK